MIKTMKLQNKIINCYPQGGEEEEKLSGDSRKLKDCIPSESMSTLNWPNGRFFCCSFSFQFAVQSTECTRWPCVVLGMMENHYRTGVFMLSDAFVII